MFDDPDELRIDRNLPRPPLNWSSGRHFCPGRPLAVLEIEEAVRAVARRWRSMRLLGPVESRGAPYIVAPSSAPIGFVPDATGSRTA
jgi:cytochrome P450